MEIAEQLQQNAARTKRAQAVQVIMTPMYERRLQKQGHGDAKRGWVGEC